MTEMSNVRRLRCACCGGGTLGRQWWNQDKGFGLCARCATWIESRHGLEYVEDCYGKFGLHHSISGEKA